jgi:hypothetical protein
MADSFRPVFDALQETAAALAQAGEANQQAIAASQQSIAALQRAGARITTIADAAMDAREEHEDLRVTVARLETLVIAQGDDLRALRDRLDNR